MRPELTASISLALRVAVILASPTCSGPFPPRQQGYNTPIVYGVKPFWASAGLFLPDIWQQIRAACLFALDGVLVDGRGLAVAPGARLEERGRIAAAIAAHPGAPGVAEGMESHARRDHHAGALRGLVEPGIKPPIFPKPEKPPLPVESARVRRQSRHQHGRQMDQARIAVFRIWRIGPCLGEIDIGEVDLLRLGKAAAGIKQKG